VNLCELVAKIKRFAKYTNFATIVLKIAEVRKQRRVK